MAAQPPLIGVGIGVGIGIEEPLGFGHETHPRITAVLDRIVRR